VIFRTELIGEIKLADLSRRDQTSKIRGLIERGLISCWRCRLKGGRRKRRSLVLRKRAFQGIPIGGLDSRLPPQWDFIEKNAT
jgi:hypothetical protein